MKKIIGLFIISTLLLSAGVYQQNAYYLRQIEEAVAKHGAYSNAYFNDVDIDGFTMPLTQIQKDSLKTLADIQLERIKVYADSLDYYTQ